MRHVLRVAQASRGRTAHLFMALWVCLLFAPAAAAQGDGFSEQAVISQIRFEIIEPPPTDTEWTSMARSLITLSAGQRFSSAALQQSIDALKQSDAFQKIHVDAEEGEGKLALVFQLTPFRRVKDIQVEGAYPLFERTVFSAMTVFPGDAYLPADIAQQKKVVETLYRRQGYIAPQVELLTWQDPQDGNYVITAKIVKGPYYRLAQLELTGNRAYSTDRLRLKMAVWRWSKIPGESGRFVEKALKDDIQKLIAFYRADGYAEVAIDYTLHSDATTGKVAAAVSIAEGPRYDIAFSGNRHLWDITLRKELVFEAEGNRHDRGLKKSVRKIEALYHRKGYLKAAVRTEQHEEETAAGTVRHVRFIVDEGPRSTVESLTFSGNRALTTADIDRQVLTGPPGIFDPGVYRPETLAQDRAAVETLYRHNGYLDATVRTETRPATEKGKVAVAVNIAEHQQTRVADLRFEGLAGITDPEARAAVALKPGVPFQQRRVQEDEKTLAAMVSEKGFPFVTTSSRVAFNHDKTLADIVYTVDAGPSAKLGDIYLTGNFRTRGRIIRNEMALQPGDPFAPKRILEAQKALRDMSIFNSVRFKSIGLREKRESIDLMVEVEERKPYYLELGSGYESDRGVFANGAVGDINFLGTHKRLWLSGQVSEIGYRADSGIADPRLLGSRISGALQFFAERREEFNQPFGVQRYGSSLTFQRKWLEKLTASLRFDFDQRDQFPTNTGEANYTEEEADEFRARSLVSATPGVIYDTRDSFIRPRKGLYSALSVDISKGLRDDLDSFVRYRLDLRYFHTPWKRLTLAALGRAGYIDPYGGNPKVPDDQLFYLGGIQNVRGYAENMLAYDVAGDPIGGRSSTVLSLESRIDLGYDFELTLFFDTGRIGDTYSSDYQEDFRSSVGLGLRYITPIGPMGLLYGHKIDPRPGESDGRWHLSIGYTF